MIQFTVRDYIIGKRLKKKTVQKHRTPQCTQPVAEGEEKCLHAQKDSIFKG